MLARWMNCGYGMKSMGPTAELPRTSERFLRSLIAAACEEHATWNMPGDGNHSIKINAGGEVALGSVLLAYPLLQRVAGFRAESMHMAVMLGKLTATTLNTKTETLCSVIVAVVLIWAWGRVKRHTLSML
jgi:hypothetical protein